MFIQALDIILGFDQFPTSAIAAIGENVSFSCSYPNAVTTQWRVNNKILRQSTDDVIISEDHHTLTIQALAEYNMTQVECVAFHIDQLPEVTCPAILLIQGILT